MSAFTVEVDENNRTIVKSDWENWIPTIVQTGVDEGYLIPEQKYLMVFGEEGITLTIVNEVEMCEQSSMES